MSNAIDNLKNLNDAIKMLTPYTLPLMERRPVHKSYTPPKPLKKTDPKKYKKIQAQKAARKKNRK